MDSISAEVETGKALKLLSSRAFPEIFTVDGIEKGSKMRIAITSSGETLDAPLDPRFGRAPKFIVYDTDSGQFESVDNAQNLNASQGAGIQAAQTVSRLGAGVVITGNCGPKAFKALTAAGIKVIVGAEGTVEQAIEHFKAGELQSTESPNVDGHW